MCLSSLLTKLYLQSAWPVCLTRGILWILQNQLLVQTNELQPWASFPISLSYSTWIMQYVRASIARRQSRSFSVSVHRFNTYRSLVVRHLDLTWVRKFDDRSDGNLKVPSSLQVQPDIVTLQKRKNRAANTAIRVTQCKVYSNPQASGFQNRGHQGALGAGGAENGREDKKKCN